MDVLADAGRVSKVTFLNVCGSMQALSGLDAARLHWGGPSGLLFTNSKANLFRKYPHRHNQK